jgi:hypothetical protein
MLRTVSLLFLLAACVAGCATQHTQIAGYTPHQMVGLPKERVLACMGAPAGWMPDGAIEVWSYNSGSSAPGAATTQGYCPMEIVMSDGRVSRVNFSQAAGSSTAAEQCASTMQYCVQ